MIFKCKTLRVRAYHLYINLPRKCLFSAYVRECSGYGVSTVYWVRTEKKKDTVDQMVRRVTEKNCAG